MPDQPLLFDHLDDADITRGVDDPLDLAPTGLRAREPDYDAQTDHPRLDTDLPLSLGDRNVAKIACCARPASGAVYKVWRRNAGRRGHADINDDALGTVSLTGQTDAVGAWGVEPFDNDAAADWAAEFEGVDAAREIDVLRRALNVEDEYLESDHGSAAVAAAQVVAWLVEPLTLVDSPYCEAARSWVRTHAPTADPTLFAHARHALTRVRGSESELAELWADADEDAWSKTLDRIDTTLRSAD